MIHASYPALAVPRRADPPAVFRMIFRSRLRGSIAPSAVDAIAGAIQNEEGYYPGSPAYTNNNPGNLVYVGQSGATLGSGGFAHFQTYDQGLAALKSQILLDATRGTDAKGMPVNTVSDLISSWAPASDPRNNTAAYIASVSSQTGFDPNAPLSSLGYDAPSSTTADFFPSSFDSDLAAITTPTLDLSGIGLSPSVPVWWIGAAVVGLLLLSRR